VDPEDRADIAAGLLKVVGQSETWQEYRTAGMKRVEEKYTWESTAQGYLAQLEKIINNKEKYVPQAKERLEIPEYFATGNRDKDISLGRLKELYLVE
jgi:sucrose-phosphate synthase